MDRGGEPGEGGEMHSRTLAGTALLAGSLLVTLLATAPLPSEAAGLTGSA